MQTSLGVFFSQPSSAGRSGQRFSLKTKSYYQVRVILQCSLKRKVSEFEILLQSLYGL